MWRTWLVCVTLCGWPSLAQALDKQGSAHGGTVGESDHTEFDIGGTLTVGSSLYNPSYAARPDNSGLALMRYAGHADIDVVGRYLSVPLDVNFFTDRTASAVHKWSPSEFDVIGGLTSTLPLASSALELGVRIERDMPVDRGTYAQSYSDVRARWLFDAEAWWPQLQRWLNDGGVVGQVTLGWFDWNPTYAARPNNTGLALFRYAAHVEAAGWHDRLSLGLDATMFTDRHRAWWRPSELDATIDLGLSLGTWHVHLAYERDVPLDERSLVQQLVYAAVSWDFEIDMSRFHRKKPQSPPHLAGLWRDHALPHP